MLPFLHCLPHNFFPDLPLKKRITPLTPSDNDFQLTSLSSFRGLITLSHLILFLSGLYQALLLLWLRRRRGSRVRKAVGSTSHAFISPRAGLTSRLTNLHPINRFRPLRPKARMGQARRLVASCNMCNGSLRCCYTAQVWCWIKNILYIYIYIDPSTHSWNYNSCRCLSSWTGFFLNKL